MTLLKKKKQKPLGQSADPSCIENAYNLLFKTAPPTFTHTLISRHKWNTSMWETLLEM